MQRPFHSIVTFSVWQKANIHKLVHAHTITTHKHTHTHTHTHTTHAKAHCFGAEWETAEAFQHNCCTPPTHRGEGTHDPVKQQNLLKFTAWSKQKTCSNLNPWNFKQVFKFWAIVQFLLTILPHVYVYANYDNWLTFDLVFWKIVSSSREPLLMWEGVFPG